MPSPQRTEPAIPSFPRPGRDPRLLTSRAVAGLVLAGLLAAGCSAGAGAGAAAGPAQDPASSQATSAGSAQSTPPANGAPLGVPASPGPSGTPTAGASPSPGSGQQDQAGQNASQSRPLAGKIVGIDPGHNGGNFSHPADMAKQIWNGRSMEDCDTTGTETDAGYTEARFTFQVAKFLRADLRRAGARVVMTRHTNTGVGPCVDQRSRILNHGHAQVSIDIHGDGGPPGGRGFAILLPVPDGPNNHVIGSSARFGRDLKRAFLAGTRMPVSNYDGVAGFQPRDDLAGLNLTTMPKVLIEVGNMRNATDAAMMVSTGFQRRAARAMAAAIITFLSSAS